VAITIHFIPYMLHCGYSAGFAAGTASLIGAMKFPGRLLFAPMESCMARRWIAALLALLQTLALLLLVIVPSAASALAPIGVGALYAGFGSYEPVIWILAAISLVSVAAVWRARVHGWTKYAVE
jgi:hypothetical protein